MGSPPYLGGAVFYMEPYSVNYILIRFIVSECDVRNVKTKCPKSARKSSKRFLHEVYTILFFFIRTSKNLAELEDVVISFHTFS